MSRKFNLTLMAVASTSSTSGRQHARANGTDKGVGPGNWLLTLCGTGDLDGQAKAKAHFNPAVPSRGCLRRQRIPKAFSTRPQTPQRGMATPASAAKDDGEAEDSDFSRLFTSRPQILRVFLSSPETAEPLENAFMAYLSHTTMTDAGSRWHQVKDGGGEKSKAINSSHSSAHSRASTQITQSAFPLERGAQARCHRDHMSLEQA
jgi:hypothetical protein